MIRRRVRALLAVAVLVVPPACTSAPPFRYYMLTSVAPGTPSALTPEQASRTTIGLGPVVVPTYLDRPNIVRRGGATMLELAENDRWGEPLQDMLPRVLADNLTARLGVDRVVVIPSLRSQPLDYQVEVNVIRFDTDAANDAVLAAEWDLFTGNSPQPVESGTTRIRRHVSDTADRTGEVMALSAVLGNLSDEIARVIAARASTKATALSR